MVCCLRTFTPRSLAVLQFQPLAAAHRLQVGGGDQLQADRFPLAGLQHARRFRHRQVTDCSVVNCKQLVADVQRAASASCVQSDLRKTPLLQP